MTICYNTKETRGNEKRGKNNKNAIALFQLI